MYNLERIFSHLLVWISVITMTVNNSRFGTTAMQNKFVVVTLVAHYVAQTTEVVTTNAITGIAG